MVYFKDHPPPLHLSTSNTSLYVKLVGIKGVFFWPEPAKWIPLGMSNNVLRHKEILALLLRYEKHLLDAYYMAGLISFLLHFSKSKASLYSQLIEIVCSFLGQGQRGEPLLAWHMVYCIVRRNKHCF